MAELRPTSPAALGARRGGLTGYTLALNYLPALFIAAGIAVVHAVAGNWYGALIAAALWIYLVPPLVARIAMAVFGRPEGRNLGQHDRAYKVWWFLFQLQALHNRLPWLDELLRLVPGLYSTWLMLWGAKASPLVYWGPGVRVLDRSLVQVGPGAVLGVDSGLSGHAGTIAADGRYVVDIAVAVVEAGAILGARSGLGPGARVRAGALLPAGRGLKPFTIWPLIRTGEGDAP